MSRLSRPRRAPQKQPDSREGYQGYEGYVSSRRRESVREPFPDTSFPSASAISLIPLIPLLCTFILLSPYSYTLLSQLLSPLPSCSVRKPIEHRSVPPLSSHSIQIMFVSGRRQSIATHTLHIILTTLHTPPYTLL